MFTQSEADFLMSERVARIATINIVSKTPHMVPICFTFDGKEIFTSLHAKSRRLRNME